MIKTDKIADLIQKIRKADKATAVNMVSYLLYISDGETLRKFSAYVSEIA